VPAAAASLLFWSCPIALYEGTTAMIDLPLVLYSAVAVLSFLEWAAGEWRSSDIDKCSEGGGSAPARRPPTASHTIDVDDAYRVGGGLRPPLGGRRPPTGSSRGFLLLAGFGLGLALGCKYHAIFWIVPALLIISWLGFRHRLMGWGWARQILYGFAISCLLALPWLVRTWAYTGNPVFPLANAVFKSSYFTPEMQQAAQAMYANEGVGRSWSALLRLPLTVTFHPGPFRGTLGFIFLLGVVVAVARSASPRRATEKRILILRYGLLCAFCYFYAWALTAQEIRYLLPIAPLLAILTVAGILGTAPAGSVRLGIVSALGALIIVAGSVIALPPIYPWVVREWTYWHSYQSPIPYLLGRQSAEDYLQRDVPSIYAYEYINRNLTGRNRVLLLNDANQFYSRVPTLYSFTIEGERILLQQSESALIEQLKESGISHVLLNYNGLAPLPGVVPRRGAYFFLEKDFQERNLKAIFSKNNVTLYQVRTS
jgi:4-amino-4-deoxy-L-arabinose transferase-like glycosyltransferase